MKSLIAALLLLATTGAEASTLAYGGKIWTGLTGSPTFRVTPGVAAEANFYLDVCAGFYSQVSATCSPTDYYGGFPLGVYDLGGSSLGVNEGPVVNGLTLFSVQYYGTPIARTEAISFVLPYQVWTPFYYENGDFEMFVNEYAVGPFTVTAAAVPLPAGAGMLALGLVGLWGVRRLGRERSRGGSRAQETNQP